MKITDFKYGLMVEETSPTKGLEKGYGLLVGIVSNNTSGSYQERANPFTAIFEVKWQTGDTTNIHPSNVKKV